MPLSSQTVATDPLSLSKSLITIARVTAKRSRLVIEGDMVYDDVKVPFIYRTSIGVKGKVRRACAISYLIGWLIGRGNFDWLM